MKTTFMKYGTTLQESGLNKTSSLVAKLAFVDAGPHVYFFHVYGKYDREPHVLNFLDCGVTVCTVVTKHTPVYEVYYLSILRGIVLRQRYKLVHKNHNEKTPSRPLFSLITSGWGKGAAPASSYAMNVSPLPAKPWRNQLATGLASK